MSQESKQGTGNGLPQFHSIWVLIWKDLKVRITWPLGAVCSGGISPVDLSGGWNICSGPSLWPWLLHNMVAEFQGGDSQGRKVNVCGMFYHLSPRSPIASLPRTCWLSPSQRSLPQFRKEDACPTTQWRSINVTL